MVAWRVAVVVVVIVRVQVKEMVYGVFVTVVVFVDIEVGDEVEAKGDGEIRAMAMEARDRFEGIGVSGVASWSLLFCAFVDDGGAVEVDGEVLLLPETEETRIVDVMVPYTVLFLYTVSGRRVTVAVFFAVSNNTSVVCIPTHC